MARIQDSPKRDALEERFIPLWKERLIALGNRSARRKPQPDRSSHPAIVTAQLQTSLCGLSQFTHMAQVKARTRFDQKRWTRVPLCSVHEQKRPPQIETEADSASSTEGERGIVCQKHLCAVVVAALVSESGLERLVVPQARGARTNSRSE